MDCMKVGNLILKLRKERNYTQKQVAQMLNLSDKTISKWERGLGCPDVSILPELSHLFGVNVEKILQGDLSPNITDGGNMKKVKFYVCPDCGNIATATGNGEFTCCGRKLVPLIAQKASEQHMPNVEVIEDDYYNTFDHPMTKDHYLSFVAFVKSDRMVFIRLYPEQNAAVRFPRMMYGELYFYCSMHGLMKSNVKC